MSGIDREKVARHLCRLAEGDPDGGSGFRPLWQKWLPEADALIEECVVPSAGITLTPEEAQLALGAIEDQIVGIYDRPLLRALGNLGHRLDPDFPAPEDDEEEASV